MGFTSGAGRNDLGTRTVYYRAPLALAQTVDYLLKHRDLTIQDAEVVVEALGHYRKRSALGYSDCLVLEIARKPGNVPMGAFDRTPANLEGAERIAA